MMPPNYRHIHYQSKVWTSYELDAFDALLRNYIHLVCLFNSEFICNANNSEKMHLKLCCISDPLTTVRVTI